MEFSFFQSLLFGFTSGLTDILPVSAQAHKTILLTLYGAENEPALLRLLIHAAVLGALYFSCHSQILRIHRQLKLARVPKRRRKRPLDTTVLMDWRLLKTMAVPVVICLMFSHKTAALGTSLNWTALLALVNALILFTPSLLPTGNKDSRSLSSVEAVLMGLGAGAGVFPSISSMGTMTSVASVCGVEKVYALNTALLIQMLVTAIQIVFDILGLVSGIGSVSVMLVLGYLAAAAAAFAGVCLAVTMLRSLVQQKGFTVFAFWSLAAAILSFIFYLMV